MTVVPSTPSTLREFVAILGGRFGALVVSIVATPILVRLLGDARYGDFSVMLSVLVLSMVLVDAGIFDGTRTFVTERREDARWVASIVASHARLAGALVVAWLVIALLLASDAVGLGDGFERDFLIVAVIILIKQFFYLFRSGLLGVGKAQLSEPLSVVETGGDMLVGIAFADLGSGVAGVLLVGAFVAATLVQGLVAHVETVRSLWIAIGIVALYSTTPLDERAIARSAARCRAWIAARRRDDLAAKTRD